jgi:hypothetical protein
MAIIVVDLLEMVDIKGDAAQGHGMTGGQEQVLGGFFLEGAPCGGSGERIGGALLAEFELADHEASQMGEDGRFTLAEIAHRIVDGADRADHLASAGDDRGAGIKANARAVRDLGIVVEARVLGGIGDDHGPAQLQGVFAEGVVDGHFAQGQADSGFVPLAMAIDHRDDADLHPEDELDEIRDALEGQFGRGVENIEAGKGIEARVIAGDVVDRAQLACHPMPPGSDQM